MDGLIHENPASKELPNPPPRSRSRSTTKTNLEKHRSQIRSADSLSTIDADQAGGGGAESIAQVDELVRRSQIPVRPGTRSDVTRSVTGTATKVNVIPLGVFKRTSQPLHAHRSLVASPVPSKRDARANTISYVTASPPPIPQSAAAFPDPEQHPENQQQAVLDQEQFHTSPSPIARSEPQLEHHQPPILEQEQLRSSPSPILQSEQLGLDIIGASKASLGGSPEPYDDHSSKSLSPQPLSPIPDYPVVEEQQAFRLVEEGVEFSRNNTSFSVRSRTYRHALDNPTPIPDPIPLWNPAVQVKVQRMPTIPSQPYVSNIKLEESGGRALEDVQTALYGTHRSAAERFYWTLPPEHDPRVLGLLTWIDRMKYSLANTAVQKFLETHVRGALLINVNYRIGTKSLTTPAVDWMTFGDSQHTLDRVLQENIATYDPMRTALVFAFLVSKTGNSVGVWLRKLPVPDIVRANNYQRLEQTMSENNPADLLVHVEATPESPPGTKSYPIPRRAPFVGATTRRPSPPYLVRPLIVEQPAPIPTNIGRAPTHIGQTHAQTLRTRTYVPQRQPQSPVYEEQVPARRNDTIKVVQAPQVVEIQPQTIVDSPPILSVPIPPPARATASSHIGSRVHVFGENPDRHRLTTQYQIQTPSRLQPAREMSSNSDRSTLSGAPVSMEIVEVEPVKKRPRWKRLLGIGRAKDKKSKKNVLVRDSDKFGAETNNRHTKKSFVEW
ncbi:hypothetical protein FRB95_010602 [Tulasnella sp. JGI-2019a]|nr:hypothetical protein FRB95_010602 [Tulasnella sp. JGI-2019a]